MSKIKVTFVETNCKKNGPIKQTLNIIRNMDKEVFEPSLVTVWPEDADNSMIDEYKKLGIPVLSANMSKKKSVLFGKKEVGQLLEQLQPDIVQGVGMPPYRMTLGYKRAIHFVTLRNYCYEDYPDYYGKIPGTVMAFLDLNLIKKRMAAGEPFVTCSESLTKMYRSRQNMLRIAGILSKGMPEVRVDLYNVNGKILFGEMTFFHWSGLMPFEPEEWDYKFGSWIELPEVR